MHMRNKTHQHLEEGGGRGGAQVGETERKKERLSRRKRTRTRRRRQYREAAEHLYYRSQRSRTNPYTQASSNSHSPPGTKTGLFSPQNSARHTTIIPDPPPHPPPPPTPPPHHHTPFLLHPKKQQQQRTENSMQRQIAEWKQICSRRGWQRLAEVHVFRCGFPHGGLKSPPHTCISLRCGAALVASPSGKALALTLSATQTQPTCVLSCFPNG